MNWLPAASFCGHLLGLGLVEVLLGLLDQRQDVAHAQDARRHPVGVEDVEVLELLAVGREHDRLPGHLAHRQRRTTAGVAVELGEDDAGEADAVAERLGGVDGVLADHRVDDEQHFLRIHRGADVRGLLHHLRVDAQPAGGVDEHHVVLLAPGELDRVARDLDRVADPVARLGRVGRHAGALADHLQLVHRVRALQVAGDEQRRVALLAQPARELAGQRRLTGTLQAGEHDHRRRLLGVLQPAGLAAEDRDQFLVDDLDDLLGRVERLGDLFAGGPLLDPRDEAAHDRQGDVGLEQGDADLARRGVDVGVRQSALAPQIGEDRGQAVGEGVEHGPKGTWRRSGGGGGNAIQLVRHIGHPSHPGVAMRAIRPVLMPFVALAALVLGLAAPAYAAGARYVALGDSYSSGVGAGNYIASSGSCDRSPNAYSALWANAHAPASYVSVACSGATTSDVLTNQVSALSSSTTLVSITIGGNDENFAGIMEDCNLGSNSTCVNEIGAAEADARASCPASSRTCSAPSVRTHRAPGSWSWTTRSSTTSAHNCFGLSQTKRTKIDEGIDVLDGSCPARRPRRLHLRRRARRVRRPRDLRRQPLAALGELR